MQWVRLSQIFAIHTKIYLLNIQEIEICTFKIMYSSIQNWSFGNMVERDLINVKPSKILLATKSDVVGGNVLSSVQTLSSNSKKGYPWDFKDFDMDGSHANWRTP
jgi:hypothetical protein